MEPVDWDGIVGKLRELWLPVFAGAGLAAGVALYLAVGSAQGMLAWDAVLVIGGIPLILGTVRKMLRGVFAADIIAMLAIIVAMLLGDSFPGVMIVLMQSSGEALERYGFRRASSSLEALAARAPKTAHRKDGANVDEVDARDVRVGDTLVVRHGDIIPVDGTVTNGTAYVDESALTGEPVPAKKRKGDGVLSGSVNSSGTFEIRTDKVSRESEYARIVELVRQAQGRKPGIQRLADRYAVYFTPLTLLLAAAGFVVTGRFDTVLAVLVVATPCPLIIAVPIAVIAGVNRAANDGIIVKSGAAIEQIGNAETVFFDKTGTITYGSPLVQRIIPVGRGRADDLLYRSACLEQLSSHPLAAALVGKARTRFRGLEAPTRFREHPSSGVEGYVGRHHVAVGSRGLLESVTGSRLPDRYSRAVAEANANGSMCLFVAVDRRLEGVVVLSDKVRPGVRRMLGRLRGMGIVEARMLTGDSAANARIIAVKAGLKSYDAGLLPADKVRIVREATASGRNTIMVGDGINDAPALAIATVGVAMGARGAGISSEAADVVLLVDDIGKVADAVWIGKSMVHIARQSIVFGLGASVVLMVIAVGGFIPPAVGAVLQEAIDITVILNALRAR